MNPLMLGLAAALLAATPGAAMPSCLAYGDPTVLLSGVVYAMEAFDEAEIDNIARPRRADFYALVMDQRICVHATAGDPASRAAANVTVVRLDMPAEMAKMVLQRRVAVQGPLAPNGAPDSTADMDPPLVMKVGGLQASK